MHRYLLLRLAVVALLALTIANIPELITFSYGSLRLKAIGRQFQKRLH